MNLDINLPYILLHKRWPLCYTINAQNTNAKTLDHHQDKKAMECAGVENKEQYYPYKIIVV